MIRDLLLASSTNDHLKRGLEAAALRHQVVSDNIANAGTPGHTPRRVRFESLFQSALDSASGSEGGKPVLPRCTSTPARSGSSGADW